MVLGHIDQLVSVGLPPNKRTADGAVVFKRKVFVFMRLGESSHGVDRLACESGRSFPPHRGLETAEWHRRLMGRAVRLLACEGED